MVRTIFFDAAGTLFDTREPVGRSYARIARRYGVDLPESEVAERFRHAFGSGPGLAFGPGRGAAELRRLEREWWRQLVARTFEGAQFTDFDAYFDALFRFFADPANWQADPEAAATLARLKDRGIGLGVLSNFDHRVYGILDGLGLAPYFDSITISSEAGFAKPSPELFTAALNRAEVAADEALHVGDSERLDMGGALAAGLWAALVDRGQAHAQPRAVGRTIRISSLASLLNLAQLLPFA
jgi:putative hydrolase of the HAD superfamily